MVYLFVSLINAELCPEIPQLQVGGVSFSGLLSRWTKFSKVPKKNLVFKRQAFNMYST